jgi:hypothetical protein
MTTKTPQAALLAAAGRHTARAQHLMASAIRLRRPDQEQLTREEILPVWDELNGISTSLSAAGVLVEDGSEQGAPPPASDSLEALRRIEVARYEGKLLLEWLGKVLPVAERLDKARGNWVGDMAHVERGETPGTNYAEAVQEMILKLQGELGTKGSGRE